MSTTFAIPALERLSQEGFNKGVLRVMQGNAIRDAVQFLRAQGKNIKEVSKAELERTVQLAVPAGSKVYEAYNATKAGMATMPAVIIQQELNGLERARAELAQDFDQMKPGLGEKYANLIEQALGMADQFQGPMAERFKELAKCPVGDMADLHDYAMGLVEERRFENRRVAER